MAALPQLETGTVVLGDVRTESLVCVAGVGALHRGRSTGSGKSVLVRVLTSSELERAAESFAREVLVVRAVEHEGAILPVNAGVEGSRAIITYEPVKGSVLQTKFPGSPLPIDDVVKILIELASVLNYAHRQPSPVFHGALTASSVVLADDAKVRLLDLGIVQALDRAGVFPDATFELLDAACVAPEQVSRTFPISAATDVFGLASIAFECLTGRAPFPATNAVEADAIIVAGKRPSARAARPELHPDVDRVLWMAWSVDPRGRHHDTIELVSALTAALSRAMPALGEVPTGPTMPGVPVKKDVFDAEEANTLIREPGADDDDPTAVREPIPMKVRRAQTLPFGLPKASPSEPPVNSDFATVPRIVAAEAVEVAFESEAPPPLPPPPPPAPVTTPMTHPREPLPEAVKREHVATEDVKTVRVVNVTGVLVSLILAGAILIAGAFVAGGQLIAQRQPVVAPAPVTQPTPTPSPTPSPVIEAPKPSPPVATASVALPQNGPQQSAPQDLPKEAGPRPSAKSVDAVRDRLRKEFEPCLKLKPLPAPGVPWMVHFEFDAPTGRPSVVELSRPFKGTIHGACMMRAALDARVPPFDGARWAIDLKFGP